MKTDTPRCPFERIENVQVEHRQIEETARLQVRLLEKRYPHPAPVLRGVHPKAHGCVQATFTVAGDIAPAFQVGLFADPGRHFDAIVRFSNASALVGPDVDCRGRSAVPATPDKHGSRGMAVKVLDVEGEMLSLDNGAHNQDFLMINQPVFAFANSEDYLRLQQILDRDNDDPARFFAPLRAGDHTLPKEVREAILKEITDGQIEPDDITRIAETFKIIREIQAAPVANPLSIQYFSAAPFLFGADRVMKFSARPRAAVPPATVADPTREHYLREVLTSSMRGADTLQFDFMVQVRVGGDDLGIENASSVWDSTTHTFERVATITIAAPQDDVDSDARRAECEALTFSPWHSLAVHQPIGSINRLRQAVYEASAAHRRARPRDGDGARVG